jgi:hypothetical protein
MDKIECHICESIINININININNIIIDNITIKTGKLNIHPICNNCYIMGEYLELTNLLSEYDVKIHDLYIKIFIYNSKIYVLSNEWRDYLKNFLHKKNVNFRKLTIDNELKEQKINNIIPSLRNAYIKYGYPNIENVINSFKKKQNIKENRLLKLIKKLKKYGKEYDKNIPLHQKYINNDCKIKDVIKDYELEKSFVYNTNYIQYLKYNDIKTARYLATIEFMNSGKKNVVIDKYALKNNTLNFF